MSGAVGNFAYYYFVEDLPEVRAQLKIRATRLRELGWPVEADLIDAAFDKLVISLDDLAAEVAVRGTEIVKDKEQDSRVRGDTGGRGGARLETYLDAQPLSDLLPGSVGLVENDEMDASVPWWSTNEEGSTARIGGVLHGVFEPGDAPPDATLFREHPLFQPLQTGGGTGVIRNPIPARRFVEDSIPEIKVIWETKFAQLKARLELEIDAIMATVVV